MPEPTLTLRDWEAFEEAQKRIDAMKDQEWAREGLQVEVGSVSDEVMKALIAHYSDRYNASEGEPEILTFGTTRTIVLHPKE